ncbi:MAG TPA: aminomethyl-transferring glycine dehydrogenase subunit GcvPA [Thermotogota bacterium]|nr:aminomethyl-transferring glycine dehydrogenase subunit GcvPA [Thermotogota bacterium]HRW33770.1 aminomethyl-transferring glycine dehydrogenase subunit GcvPA [Thermotogota bacterium]
MPKRYIPHTQEEINEMLALTGVKSTDELFSELPVEKRCTRLNLNNGLSEVDVMRKMKEWAQRNADLEDYSVFLGGGIYKHLIPQSIQPLVERGEFLTAYTPYQAEVSQGSLQMFYEFQTMVCEITGMDVANASMYDGGTAAAEAMLMSCHVKNKNHYLVAQSIHPEYLKIIETYSKGPSIEIETVQYDRETGMIDLDDLKQKIKENTAGFLVGYTNFFGIIEDIQSIREVTKDILLTVSCNPMTLGVLKAPGEYNVDIVTGEAQPFGGSLYLGGMTLGMFATKKEYMRKMPGRIIGKTTDMDGNTGYVMVLQTREQHIRRDKATSNICSNHAHNALVATIYLSLLGKNGLKEAATRSLKKAHFLAERIDRMDRFDLAFTGPFFNEFTVKSQQDPKYIRDEMLKEKIMGPLPVIEVTGDEAHENLSLIAVTEANRMEEISFFASRMEELL